MTSTTPAGLRSASDLMNLDDELSDAELEVRAAVREFVDRRIRPNIADWFDRAVFPTELVPEMAELGLLGMHLEGYGCAGRTAVEYGIAMQELEAGDSGIRTFVSVQGSLAMSAIRKFGSEEQKNAWLPRMARGEAIGCFGLTEPTAGSDPANMVTDARLEGGEWVLRPLAEGERLAVGDQLEVHLSLTALHAAEYVHLRDPRGAGFEPETLTSGYRWDLGLARYEEIRDSGTNFFIEWLPAGEYTLKHRLRAATAGAFRSGPATLQSMYAPEFTAYSSGQVIEVAGE